jgi:hypothetical protein
MKKVAVVAALLGVTLVLVGSPRGTRLAMDAVDQGSTISAASNSTADAPVALDASVPSVPEVSDADLNSIVGTYCIVCHNDAVVAAGTGPPVSFQGFDVAHPEARIEVAEKMVKKLRAGMMPPPGMMRPAGDTLLTLVETLEKNLDKAAARNPDPGVRPSQRLNRREYEYAIRELLALEVDAGRWLPLDVMSANFDNVAEVQGLSPLVLESYMNAASEISRMAIGDRSATPYKWEYTNSDYVSQHPWDHVEGAPYGTRGGMVVKHVFPVDGYYQFNMTFSNGGNTRLEEIDVSIDGENVATLAFESRVNVRTTSADGRDAGGGLLTEPIFVRAGQRSVSASFVRKGEGPYEDLIRPHEWALAGGGSGAGLVTLVPHLRDLIIDGPYNPSGLSDTPSRQKVFSCRPTSESDERTCAQEIVQRVGSAAYRRALGAEDVEGLMVFYDMGAERGGFEEGVRMSLEAILANPSFYYRWEQQPANVRDGRPYRVSDHDLASRLSFFIWGTPPDAELIDLANRGRLSDERTLEQQTRRMLADPRAEALGARFAGQWLRLQDLAKVHPDPNFFPNFDENLARAMARETELFFYNLVKEDLSVLDLYRANYTFVNDRLARHYGIPNVAGSSFQRVQYPDNTRVGLLGHGSVLVQTSLAGRTSPVLRGKWVMEVLMGTPPPPPPPNVSPALDATSAAAAGRILTTRERMEMHRANPTCNACHRFMDPIGLSLDNFDVMGRWRYRENGASLDTRGELYDGTPISSPSELAAALLKRPIPLMRTFTENLLTYALGRRLEPTDMTTVRAIEAQAESNDYRVSSFILGVVKSDAFLMKRAEVAQAEDGR